MGVRKWGWKLTCRRTEGHRSVVSIPRLVDREAEGDVSPTEHRLRRVLGRVAGQAGVDAEVDRHLRGEETHLRGQGSAAGGPGQVQDGQGDYQESR